MPSKNAVFEKKTAFLAGISFTFGHWYFIRALTRESLLKALGRGKGCNIV
jgi:hypothetical protein